MNAAAVELYSAISAPTADAFALYAWDYLLQGQVEKAEALVMPELIRGSASPELQKVTAGLYQSVTMKNGRGRRALIRPPMWMEIGSRYVACREKGLTWEDAVAQLMIEFPRGKTSIEDAVRFSLDVEKRVDQLIARKNLLPPR